MANVPCNFLHKAPLSPHDAQPARLSVCSCVLWIITPPHPQTAHFMISKSKREQERDVMLHYIFRRFLLSFLSLSSSLLLLKLLDKFVNHNLLTTSATYKHPSFPLSPPTQLSHHQFFSSGTSNPYNINRESIYDNTIREGSTLLLLKQ